MPSIATVLAVAVLWLLPGWAWSLWIEPPTGRLAAVLRVPADRYAPPGPHIDGAGRLALALGLGLLVLPTLVLVAAILGLPLGGATVWLLTGAFVAVTLALLPLRQRWRQAADRPIWRRWHGVPAGSDSPDSPEAKVAPDAAEDGRADAGWRATADRLCYAARRPWATGVLVVAVAALLLAVVALGPALPRRLPAWHVMLLWGGAAGIALVFALAGRGGVAAKANNPVAGGASPADPTGSPTGPTSWWHASWLPAAVLALAGALALGLRIWPYRDPSTMTFGYDWGFYLAMMDHFEAGLPQFAWGSQPRWMEGVFPPGLPAWHVGLHTATGLTAEAHLRWLHPLAGAATVVPMYALVRHHWGNRAGLASAFLFAISRIQHEAFGRLFEKNVVAMFLLFVCFYLVARRRWWTAAIAAVGVLPWHRPTALLLFATLAVAGASAIARRRDWQGWAQMALVVAVPAVAVVLAAPAVFLDMAERLVQTVVVRFTQDGGAAIGSGSFMDFERYQLLAAAYLALGLAGVGLAPRQGGPRLLAIALVLCLGNVVLELVFHRRFIVMLDVVVVALAGPVVVAIAARLVEHWPGPWRVPWRAVATIAVVAVAASPTLAVAMEPPVGPYVTHTLAERNAVLGLDDVIIGNATLLTTNMAAPWVDALSRHRTIGPALLGDVHSQAHWNRFHRAESPEQVARFFRPYEDPLFIVFFPRHDPTPWGPFLEPPYFDLVILAEEIIVLHYLPDGGAPSQPSTPA